jgi:hypothetical protein
MRYFPRRATVRDPAKQGEMVFKERNLFPKLHV